MQLAPEDIMDRLSRLCRLGTSVMCRPTFPVGECKWYVSMQGVDVPTHTTYMSGATPQDAILNTWRVIALGDRMPTLIRYFCGPKEPVPGNGPQVWVRWSREKDDWEDVTPPRDHPWARCASSIRPYQEHKWREANFQ